MLGIPDIKYFNKGRKTVSQCVTLIPLRKPRLKEVGLHKQTRSTTEVQHSYRWENDQAHRGRETERLNLLEEGDVE